MLCAGLTGCCVLAGGPPPSQFPSADAALDRMHETHACSRGLQGEAKVDYFDERGRVRGNVMYLGVLPDQLRFDVYTPFGVMLSTLTSDGEQFALFDLKAKQLLYGPAAACNVARFTRVPVPPSALVQLLRGEAPVLVHEPSAATIEWDCDHYVIEIRSHHDAREQIHLAPAPADWNLPWQQQRVRLLEVRVSQQGTPLYRAELKDHAIARTAAPRTDPDGLEPDVPPSGPACQAEVPRKLRLLVPETDRDLLLVNREVSHNPPLLENVFRQTTPAGVAARYAPCGP